MLRIVTLIAMLVTSKAFAAVIRVEPGVDPGNTASGTNWSTDVTNLQRALQLTEDGDEIWVAAGTYYTDEGQGQVDDSRDSVFYLKSGVGLYGGFSGSETSRAERDATTNICILSGDINQDESGSFFSGYQPPAAILANSYHVLWLEGGSSTTEIAGFTITAGCAWNGPDASHLNGGGIYSEFSSVSIDACVFTDNYAAQNGGAIYFGDLGDAAPLDYAGTSITNCSFEGNKGYYGGAVYSDGASPSISNSQFISNGYDLGFSGINGSSLGSIYSYSYATLAGAILSKNDNPATIASCLFSGNTAVAIYADDASLTVSGTRFTGNMTEGGGAAISAYGSSVFGEPVVYRNIVIYNCLFDHNDSEEFGAGAIAFSGAIQSHITNSTFSENSGRGTGASALRVESTETTLANLIIWGNYSGDTLISDIPESGGGDQGPYSVLSSSIQRNSDSVIHVTHSLIAGTTYHLNDETNLNGMDGGNDPRFISASDFRLNGLSPAIGAGSNAIDLDGSGEGATLSGELLYDLDGLVRVQGAAVDMGAYEFEYSGDYSDFDSDGLSDDFEWNHTIPKSKTAIDPNSDEDMDGLSALEEFVFGTDPEISDLPYLEIDLTTHLVFIGNSSDLLDPGYFADRDFLVIQFRIQRSAAPFIRVQAQSTTDLSDPSTWTANDLIIYDKTVDPEDSAMEYFKVRSSDPIEDSANRFFRLNLELK